MGFDVGSVGVGRVDFIRSILRSVEQDDCDAIVEGVVVGLLHYDGLLHGTAVREHIADALVECAATHTHFSTVWVGEVVHAHNYGCGAAGFRFVGECDLEHGRFAHGHVLHDGIVHIDARHHNLLRLGHDFGAGTVVVSDLLRLPVAGGLATAGHEDGAEFVGSVEHIHRQRVVGLLLG